MMCTVKETVERRKKKQSQMERDMGKAGVVKIKWGWWGMRGKVKVTDGCRARTLNQEKNSK